MEYKYEGCSLKSGVYKLTNKLNGRIYIGSAREFKERWKTHTKRLKSGNHSNKFLQADFNKCGEDVFIFEVIEVVEGSQENRLLVEQRYIDQHYDDQQQCYNLTRSVNKRGPKCHSCNPEKTAAKRKENPNFRINDLTSKIKKLKVVDNYFPDAIVGSVSPNGEINLPPLIETNNFLRFIKITILHELGHYFQE